MGEGKKTVNIIISIIAITLGVKFIGFFRDALLGSKIGASYESDAYIMALNSTTIIFLSIGSAISTGSIPFVVQRLKNSEDKGNKYLNKLISSTLVCAIIIVILGIIFSPWFLSIVAKGFYGEKRDLVIILTRIMFPSLIFISTAYIFVAYLQSIGKFIIPAIISLPFNAILIFYLIFLLKDYGIIGLALATLIGWSLQLFIQIPFAKKEGFRFSFELDFKDDDIKGFFKSLIPIVFVASIHQINILIDNMYASTLGHGIVSSIYYANILYQAIVTTTVYGISAVMFPKFNYNLSEENIERFKNLVFSVLSTVIYLLIPMAVGLLVLDNTIISLVFERGQFNSEDTIITSMILGYYSIGMVGFGVIDTLNKAFYSLKDLMPPVIVSTVIIFLNLILSKVLLLYIGLKGVVLGTALSLVIGAIILFYIFTHKTGDNTKDIIYSLLKVIVASTIMAIVLLNLKNFLIMLNIGRLITLFIITVAGIGVYTITTIILKDKTSIYIYENYFKSKLKIK